jgi:hypothetical protein
MKPAQTYIRDGRAATTGLPGFWGAVTAGTALVVIGAVSTLGVVEQAASTSPVAAVASMIILFGIITVSPIEKI